MTAKVLLAPSITADKATPVREAPSTVPSTGLLLPSRVAKAPSARVARLRIPVTGSMSVQAVAK